MDIELTPEEHKIYLYADSIFNGQEYRSFFPQKKNVMLFKMGKLVDISNAYDELAKKVENQVLRRNSVEGHQADNEIAGLMASCISQICRDVDADAIAALLPGQRPLDPEAFKARVHSGAIKSVLELDANDKNHTAMMTVQFRDQDQYFVVKVCDVSMTLKGVEYVAPMIQKQPFQAQEYAGRFDDLFCHRSSVALRYPLTPGIKKHLRPIIQKVKTQLNIAEAIN